MFSDYIFAGWVYWIFMIAYGLTIISVVAMVVSENRNPVKSLAWVTVLLVMPAIGLIIYFLFGRSIKNKRLISKRNRRKLKRHEAARPFDASQSQLPDEAIQQIRLGQSLMSAPYYDGNSAKIFTDGHSKFDTMLADIADAKSFICLQYYIFEDDLIGTRVADALIAKARQGVKVRIIYDHVGSFRVKRRFFRRMTDAGIEVYPFFKVSFPGLGSRINWRNHRKICIIDGRIGYIGGMNIADRYVTGGNFDVWRDVHLRVTGPILRSLYHSFAYDWNLMGRPLPDDVINPADQRPTGNVGMQLVTSGPTGQWSNIAMLFLKAIGNAKKCVYIQTPYFLPTEALFNALQAAALAKIDVRLMMPRNSDSALLRYASFSYIKDCLRSGIKVYLYEPGMLHSKMIIVDDTFVTVGSTNFDFRSFEHNFESNLFIYSPELNLRLKDVFMTDLESCTRITPYDWARRPRMARIKESVMRLFAPIL